MKQHKVFGIGFHRTATSSLGAALVSLGYTLCEDFGVFVPTISIEARAQARRALSRFDAFEDNPWPILYRDLLEWCPTGHFVLTVRDPVAWIGSVVSFFGAQSTPMREWIYGVGSPKGSEGIYLTRYQKHNADVLAHFNNKGKRLLIMDITKGDGWDVLCPFIEEPIPSVAFPHVNPLPHAGPR